MATTLTFKQEEAKTIQFTVTDEDGVAVDLSDSSVEFSFYLKKNVGDSSYSIEKSTSSFGTGSASSGIVTLALSATDLDLTAGTYIGELKIYFSDVSIDKSVDLSVVMQPAINV